MVRHGAAGFSASVTIEGAWGEHRLGTGTAQSTESRSRVCRIDGAPAASPAAFADYVRLVWLTPDLDALFRGPAGDRRRFLDRLVLAVDSEHGARVSALERALRTRNRLLEEHGDPLWLDAVEREGRSSASPSPPRAGRRWAGSTGSSPRTHDPARPSLSRASRSRVEIDDLVAALPAVDAEDRLPRPAARGPRGDRAAGRTLVGPQASDLAVRHGPKDIPANLASTGEQKALLIGLVLAHARLVATMTGIAPLVLLDEGPPPISIPGGAQRSMTTCSGSAARSGSPARIGGFSRSSRTGRTSSSLVRVGATPLGG